MFLDHQVGHFTVTSLAHQRKQGFLLELEMAFDVVFHGAGELRHQAGESGVAIGDSRQRVLDLFEQCKIGAVFVVERAADLA